MANELKGILRSVWQDLVKKQKEQDAEGTQRAWDEIVGPTAREHTRIVYLTKNKIHVNVDNSAWLYELTIKKESIQRELKKRLGCDELKLRLGNIKETSFGDRPEKI